jgi:hypothetical protein
MIPKNFNGQKQKRRMKTVLQERIADSCGSSALRELAFAALRIVRKN